MWESGKRVLFLSEKQAALDVVKRRFELPDLATSALNYILTSRPPRQSSKTSSKGSI